MEDLDKWTNYMYNLPYTQGTVKVYGKDRKEGRLTVLYGLENNLYSYSGRHILKQQFPGELEYLRQILNTFIEVHFDSLLINYYRDGQDSIGMHSDKEVIKDSPVASISLGSTRNFIIECRPEAPVQHPKVIIPLAPGSLFVMGRNFQRYYKHGVNKESQVTTPRFNLTYRITK
jgi:alkylated DNA repair dioxygenase AlkB